ncbi:hypothetical protein MMC13_005139 [Lambiella insularis]|nr:hypothetical protein [Lambiella insularis]
MSAGKNESWHWPDDIPPHSDHMNESIPHRVPGAFQEDAPVDHTSGARQRKPSPKREGQAPKPAKTWPPRTCRICLETVLPTFHQPSTSFPDILQSPPSVTYESDDPAAGRLIRPCKCKGSSRYVHEGCLQEWRHADPAYGKRNYWQCPTCGFRYRLERMRWGRAISSTATQLVLTISILFLAMFMLGFVADPIINLYLDPYSTLSSAAFSSSATKVDPLFADDDSASWTEHFVKGLASLGLLGFVKVLLALSPWQWWNLRSSGIMSGGARPGANGRDRLANISWVVVILGVGTFLWVLLSQLIPTCSKEANTPQAVYKGVRAWSRRTLEKASERVIDVPLSDDDEDADDGGESTTTS